MPTEPKLKDTRLLFGLRTSQDVTLTVTGQPGPTAPDLWIKSNEQDDYTSITYDREGSSWTTALPPGDHIVRMDAPGQSWFCGKIAFTLSAASTIVVPGAAVSSQPVSWISAAGTLDNPKDPTPPLRALQPVPDAAWLCSTLQDLYDRLEPQRSLPSSGPFPRRPAPSSTPR